MRAPALSHSRCAQRGLLRALALVIALARAGGSLIASSSLTSCVQTGTVPMSVGNQTMRRGMPRDPRPRAALPGGVPVGLPPPRAEWRAADARPCLTISCKNMIVATLTVPSGQGLATQSLQATLSSVTSPCEPPHIFKASCRLQHPSVAGLHRASLTVKMWPQGQCDFSASATHHNKHHQDPGASRLAGVRPASALVTRELFAAVHAAPSPPAQLCALFSQHHLRIPAQPLRQRSESEAHDTTAAPTA